MALVPESTMGKRKLMAGLKDRASLMPAPYKAGMHQLDINPVDENAQNHALLSSEIKHKVRFRPLVVMFIGRRGGGKSAAMSATAYMQYRRYLKEKVNFSVVANYKLAFANMVSPYLVDDLMDFPDWAENLYICIDEAAASFPSRRSMAGANVNFSNFLTQIRKRRCEVVFTTQFPQVMDVQILLQVDLFIRCRAFNANKSIELQCYDWWGQWTGNDHRKPWPPESGMQDWTKYYHHVDRIWDKYDTSEVVAAMWSKSRDAVIAREGYEFIGEEDDAVQQPDPEKLAEARGVIPETMTQLLMQAGNSFGVLSMLEQARRMESGIKSRGDLADYLEDHGYQVQRSGTWIARRAEPGVSAEMETQQRAGV